MGSKRKTKQSIGDPVIGFCPFCRFSLPSTKPDAALIRTNIERIVTDYAAYTVQCNNCLAWGPIREAKFFQNPTDEHAMIDLIARNEAAEAWNKLGMDQVLMAGLTWDQHPIRFVMKHYDDPDYGKEPPNERWHSLGALTAHKAKCPWCKDNPAFLHHDRFIPKKNAIRYFMRCSLCGCRGPLLLEVDRDDRPGLITEVIRLFNEPATVQAAYTAATSEAMALQRTEQALLNQTKRQKRLFDQ